MNRSSLMIFRVLCCSLLVFLMPGAPAGAVEPAAGVVIESVAPRSVGAAAGLEPGDLILSWSSAGSGGSIRSPYDLLPLEIEEAPRRAVTLRGRRGGEERAWTLAASDWGIEARPVLPSGLAPLDLAGQAEAARNAGDVRLAAWFLERLAGRLAAAGKWPEADAAYQEALEALERVPDPAAAAQLLRGWGETFQGRGAWDPAVERYRKALALDRAAAPKSLAAARSLDALGVTTAKKGEHDADAEELLRQALAIREELAPGSTEVAASLIHLGILARRRGKLAAAEEMLVRGEQIERRLAPDSLDHGRFFQALGNIAWDRADLAPAENLFRQALAVYEKAAPESVHVVGSLTNLANIATQRGDLAAADDLLRRVLALQERAAPDELGRSETLISLCVLAKQRGDLEAAEIHCRRALELQERLAPGGIEMADGLASLGELAILRGDFATARTALRRSLEIQEKRRPGGLRLAVGLQMLAQLEADHGSLATSEELLRRALAIVEKAAPESLTATLVLSQMGESAARRGRLQEALALYRRALEIQRKLVPATSEEARTLYDLGRTERRAGRSREGIRDLCRSVDVLDHQRSRLGGTPEAKISFEARLGDYYHACLEGLLDLGRPAEAFHVLERGRARSFLALLAERDLRFADLPPELAAERRRVNAEYDRVQSQLASLSAGRDDAEVERLTGALGDLRTRQEEIFARIRREAPRSAALEAPEPLALEGVRAALDPGTVLLEYAVGAERSWLFAVQPAGAQGPGLSVFRVPLGAKGLRKEVEGFRGLLKDPASDPAKLRAEARRLYDLLVRPAEARIAGAQRLLVAPDGPLHTIPFAALLRGDRFLVERKPVHSVLSATVYAELVRSRPPRREPGAERVAAFGDPVYPSLASGPVDPALREAVRRGWTLEPLPFSGQEVKDLAAQFPQAEVYLGRDATEERAKAAAPQARLVHFACHGLLDERFPLNSGLALSLPEKPGAGQDNGLLQAWEIFESVRLEADLVTLSACDTALGREMAGEGLVGLTRAFQYAGARSVLATLWGVADRTTAGLMKRFYGYLRAGKPKDEALRAAQIDQIREGPGLSHPFHWAAFQLAGDWR